MSVAIVIVVSLLAVVVAFLAGAVFGYGTRVSHEQDTYRDERIKSARDERIKSALKHWHGHTSHRGYTIFSPDVKEGVKK